MIGLHATKKFLDGRQVFDLWIETGSIRKAISRLLELDCRNPKNGRPPTPMGAWGAAWLFALENLEYSKSKAYEGWKFNGTILEDEVWYGMVLKEARYLYSPQKFDKFLDKNPTLKDHYEKSRSASS